MKYILKSVTKPLIKDNIVITKNLAKGVKLTFVTIENFKKRVIVFYKPLKEVVILNNKNDKKTKKEINGFSYDETGPKKDPLTRMWLIMENDFTSYDEANKSGSLKFKKKVKPHSKLQELLDKETKIFYKNGKDYTEFSIIYYYWNLLMFNIELFVEYMKKSKIVKSKI